MDGTLPSPAPLTLTVRRVGNALTVTLPDDLASRLRVSDGSTLYVTDTPTGAAVTSLSPEGERQVRLGLEFMRRYDATFRALAK